VDHIDLDPKRDKLSYNTVLRVSGKMVFHLKYIYIYIYIFVFSNSKTIS